MSWLFSLSIFWGARAQLETRQDGVEQRWRAYLQPRRPHRAQVILILRLEHFHYICRQCLSPPVFHMYTALTSTLKCKPVHPERMDGKHTSVFSFVIEK